MVWKKPIFEADRIDLQNRVINYAFKLFVSTLKWPR